MNGINDKGMDGIQLFSVAGCFAFGSILKSAHTTLIAGTDSWICAILGAICYIPLLWALLFLARKFPGMSIVGISQAVFGRFGGRIASAVYVYFMVTLCALHTLEAADFVREFVLPGTPLILILAVFLLFCAYCSKMGFLSVAKVSTPLLAGAVAVLAVNSLLSLTNADFSYLLPMLRRPFMDYAQGTHIISTVPFGETFALMQLLPLMKKGVGIKKPLIMSAALTAFVLVVIHVREAVSLGPLLPYVLLPNYETIRLIDLGNTITRVESIYAFIMISVTSFKVATLFYAACSGMSEISGAKRPAGFALPLAALTMIYAARVFASSDAVYMMPNIAPFVASTIEYALPGATLITAIVKSSFSRKQEARAC